MSTSSSPGRCGSPPAPSSAATGLRCLSVRQPWAWAICHGAKRVENRTWSTDHRGPIAIHASANQQDVQAVFGRFGSSTGDAAGFTFGAIIGVVDIVDCVPLGAEIEQDPWAEGPFCWLLNNARLLADPIPAKGRANLFALAPDVVHSVVAQLEQPPPAQEPESVERLLRAVRPDPGVAALAQAASYGRLGLFPDLLRAAERAIDAGLHDSGRARFLRAVGLAATGQLAHGLDEADEAVRLGWLGSGGPDPFPGNLAALYHAAQAAAFLAGESSRDVAGAHFERFARVANLELRDVAAARRGYAAYKRLDAAAAVRAYAVAGSAFDNAQDLAQLAADAQPAGLDQAEVENLRVAVLASEMSRTVNKLRIVNSSLDEWIG